MIHGHLGQTNPHPRALRSPMNRLCTPLTAWKGSLGEQAIQTLSEAFTDDPTSKYFLPEAQQRAARLRPLFRAAVRHGLDGGSVDLVDGGNGVAVWLRSATARMTVARMIRTGVPATAVALGFGASRRVLQFLDWIEKRREEVLPSPHWYLLNLAVQPDCQGQGLGSALLRHGTERAGREVLPCFLETASVRNVELYRRHGFRQVYEATPTSGGPQMWGFVRPAG